MSVMFRTDTEALTNICRRRGLGTDYCMFYGFSHCNYLAPLYTLERQADNPFKRIFNYSIGSCDVSYFDPKQGVDRVFPRVSRASPGVKQQCKNGVTKFVRENILREDDHLQAQPLFFVIDTEGNPYPLTAENALSKTKTVTSLDVLGNPTTRKVNDLITHSELRRLYKLWLDPRTRSMVEKSVVFLKKIEKKNNQIENIAAKKFVPSRVLPPDVNGNRQVDSFEEHTYEEVRAPWLNAEGELDPDWKKNWNNRSEGKPAHKPDGWRKDQNDFFEARENRVKPKKEQVDPAHFIVDIFESDEFQKPNDELLPPPPPYTPTGAPPEIAAACAEVAPNSLSQEDIDRGIPEYQQYTRYTVFPQAPALGAENLVQPAPSPVLAQVGEESELSPLPSPNSCNKSMPRENSIAAIIAAANPPADAFALVDDSENEELPPLLSPNSCNKSMPRENSIAAIIAAANPPADAFALVDDSEDMELPQNNAQTDRVNSLLPSFEGLDGDLDPNDGI